MHNKIKIILPLIFSICMTTGIWIGYKLKDNIKSPQGFFDIPKTNTLQEVIELLSRKYIDSLNIDSLKTKTINNLLYQLDPYSTYIPANKVQQSNTELAGSFEGIGIEFQIIRDTINVLQILTHTNNENSELQIGDKILKIDEISVTGSNILPEKIQQLLQNGKTKTVQLSLLRNTKILSIPIKKRFIPVQTIDAAYKLDPTTGYIRINRFAENTYADFMQSLENLTHNNIQKLILDLRDNNGGLLSSAVDIADEFLDEDKLIVSVQGNQVPETEYHCKRNGLFEKGKLIVLVNENTASAAEVLAGTLQDWDRATIVGASTFGKGLIQEQFMLSDGSALRLAVAKYYLPTGRNIQKKYTAYYHTINTNTFNKKSYKTPAGHIVYADEGIMPDIIIPTDSIWKTTIAQMILTKNILIKFAYQYYVTNRLNIITYKTPDNFAQYYTVSDTIWNNFIHYTHQNNIDINNISIPLKIAILKRIKALLARFLWGNEGFYKTYNLNDYAINKAILL